MNKKYAKLLALLLAIAMMTAMLIGCKSKEEPVATEPAAETKVTEAPAVAELEEKKTEPEATEEEIIETEPEVDAPEPGTITYEEYMALEIVVQQAYYEKFDTPDDFYAWFNAAKAEHEVTIAPTEATEPATQIPEDTEDGEGGIIIEEGVEEWE